MMKSQEKTKIKFDRFIIIQFPLTDSCKVRSELPTMNFESKAEKGDKAQKISKEELNSLISKIKKENSERLGMQDEIFCPVCLELFDKKQKIPIMICLNIHNVCKTCLELMKIVVKCPICSQHMIERNSMRGNRLILSLLEKEEVLQQKYSPMKISKEEIFKIMKQRIIKLDLEKQQFRQKAFAQRADTKQSTYFGECQRNEREIQSYIQMMIKFETSIEQKNGKGKS